MTRERVDPAKLRAIEEAARVAVQSRAERLMRRKRADEKREQRRVRAGLGASFLEPGASSTLPPGGAYTAQAPAGVEDTPTSLPRFLPPVDPDTRPMEVVWSPQPGPQYHFIHCPVTDVVFGGSRGGGKLHPMRSNVCTPMGWKRIGDLKVGDAVTDPTTGGSTRVIRVSPQGEHDIYRVTCDDGASCEVGMEHLWAFRLANHAKPRTKPSSERRFAVERLGATMPDDRWGGLRVGTTADVLDALDRGHGVRIPLTEPVIFTVNGRGESGPVDPYLAGVLLGDGSIGNLVVTACDDGIRDALVGFGFSPMGALHTDGKPKSWMAAGACRKALRTWVGNHGLGGRHSWDKFIPPYVFTAGLEYRLAFLQGLMDTDGTVDDRGRCYFTSTSEALTEGVRHIVRSLGGKASSRERATRYTHKGEKLDGRPSWTVRIWMRRTSVLFRLQRKRDRCTDSWNGGHELTREIVSVEKVGREEAVCIRVDSPYSLYLTDDFIVTHNSDALIGDAAIRAGKYGAGFRGLFLRRQQVELADIKMRMQAVYGPIGAKWSEQHQTWAFPGGGTLVLKYLANDDDALLYKGWSVSALYVDEIGDFPSRRPIDLLWGAMRSASGVPIVRRMSCNPGGAGHLWVKQLYLSQGPYKVFKHTPNPDLPDDAIDAVFIPSRLEDNKILMKNDPRYEARIAAAVGGDKALWRAWRYGDWDVLAGTYFSFDEKKNVAVPPPMPDYLPRWMAIDWGYTHQTAVLWVVDFGDRAYVYRERSYTSTDPVSLGMYLAEVNGDEQVQNIYLSPDAFARRTSENTVATDLHDGFRRAHEMRGCALLPAPEPAFNDRVNGWQSVAAGLQHGRLMISPSCSELIRTLPAMVRDPKRPNDIQKVDGDDFCLAAGTMVRMADGTERRIEDVEEGDVLETPCGPGVVSAAGCTAEDAELMEVVLEDGRALTGTPGHHLYDGPTGEKRAIKTFLPGDTILVWAPQANQSSTPAASSAATRPPSPRAGGTTSGPDTEPRRGFTGRSGQTPTAPSRPGLSSTTSMGTPPTTASKTSPLSPAERMRESTGGSSAWPTVENESGVRAAGPNSSTGPDTEAGYSAGTLVSRRTDGEPSWTTSKEPARAVPPHSGRVSTNPPGTARVVALRRLTERGSVYNLTVDCCHRFYANDILSANCDSLRYLWATRRRGEVVEPIEVRASREITAEDPNHRAMQERLFLAREAGGGGHTDGVILRGRMRPSRYFE